VKRLLLTGSTGFVGSHVAAASNGGAFAGWQVVPLPRGMDLREREPLRDWLASQPVDAVVHLAAQSFVPRSFQDPAETLEINVVGTSNLIELLAGTGFGGRFLYVSSGDVYGRLDDSQLPVSEITVPQPRSPYAVSKIAAEMRCLQAMRSDGLDVLIARPFNHVGPGQAAQFAVPALARQVAAIAAGRQPPVIRAGDVDVTRDFTDVRDVVAAYAAILSGGTTGTIYVVGSGRERTLRDVLRRLCELAGVNAELKQDATLMRPAEQRRMVADASLLRRHTGWSPSIPFDQTLTDILTDASLQAL